MVDPSPSASSIPPAPRSRPPVGPLVLIVEDDRDIRYALAQILAEEGYPSIQARNGLEGLERLRSGPPPKLVLLDLMMPVMDGWQFQRALRADPELSTIPIVVVTADALAEERVRATGVAGFLTKPLSIEDLLAAVRSVVGPARKVVQAP
jgi:two-component system, chemotaxis family, chemotaxis protein CheY